MELRLSDRLRLTLSVEGRATVEVQPLEKITASPDWEVQRRSRPEKTTLAAGRARWQQTIVFIPLKPGDVPLPIEPLSYREVPGSEWETVAWQIIPVRVGTEILSPDLGELRDSTPPEQLPALPVWRIPIAWVVLPLGLAAVCLCIVYCRRRARRAAALPPEAWALSELDQISAVPPASPAEVERYYILLSQVVRKYLQLRFQLPAEEQTTAEFVVEMQKSLHLSSEEQQTLRDLLEHCDLAKFAREIPAPAETLADAAAARAFVAQTAVKQPSNQGQGK